MELSFWPVYLTRCTEDQTRWLPESTVQTKVLITVRKDEAKLSLHWFLYIWGIMQKTWKAWFCLCFPFLFFESKIVMAYTQNPSTASEVQIIFQKKHLEKLICYQSWWWNTHDSVRLNDQLQFPFFHCIKFQLLTNQSVFRVWICNEDGSELLAMVSFKREQFCHMEHLVAWFPLRYPGFQINCQVKIGIKKQKWVSSFVEEPTTLLCVR
jgi:hypothetical protein